MQLSGLERDHAMCNMLEVANWGWYYHLPCLVAMYVYTQMFFIYAA
jgi:hypothetical protein